MEASMDDARGALGQTVEQTRDRSSSQATLSPAEIASRTEASPLRWTSGGTHTLFVQQRHGCGVESMLFGRRQFVLDQFFDSFQHQNLAGIAEGKCNARRPRSRGAADPMHVAFGVVR